MPTVRERERIHEREVHRFKGSNVFKIGPNDSRFWKNVLLKKTKTSRRIFLFETVIKIEERSDVRGKTYERLVLGPEAAKKPQNVRYAGTFAGEISPRTTPATIASLVVRDDGATIRWLTLET